MSFSQRIPVCGISCIKPCVLESLFNKVAGLQDCCTTYLLHLHLGFYFSLGKTLKKFHELSINYVLLKNIKCKVIFTEAYLEPSRTSMMKLFPYIVRACSMLLSQKCHLVDQGGYQHLFQKSSLYPYFSYFYPSFLPQKRYYFPASLGKYILFSSQEIQHICDTTRSKAKGKMTICNK